MPRSIWSGAISFGLVSVPVKLYSAVSRKTVRFNQLDAETNTRIRQKRVNAEGEEVPYERIVKGYEVAKDSYVIVTDDELAALSPKATRMIDISDFVDESEIDPIFYDSAYYLAPDELAKKSYTLLARAMEESNRVAIASFVMRNKQYLVAIRPSKGALMMSTMVYADEVVAVDDIPGLDDLDELETTEAELAMASQLIDSLTADFEPERYEDTYRAEIVDLLEAKASGETMPIDAPAAAEDDGVVDLLAALEASVNAAKEARRSAGDGGSGDAAPAEKRSSSKKQAGPSKKRAKKASARSTGERPAKKSA